MTVTVEVVFALPQRQVLLEVQAEAGATVADIIQASGIAEAFPDADLLDLPVGIWGRRVERSAAVSDGDRVEIYRMLELDPREARRQLAEAGRTMADGSRD